jgi:hypothetical protein
VSSSHDLPVMQNVDTWFADGAISLIRLDRDESDTFDLSIENLSDSKEVIPTRATAFELLPAGSKWTQVVGWHSYIGIPFPPQNPQWIALGGETVVQHQTRGAFPIFRAYTHQFPLSIHLIERLEKLANSLCLLSDEEQASVNSRNGLIRTISQSPHEHHWIESWIIRYAAKSYRKQRTFPFLFRTLALSESQLAGEKYPHPKIRSEPLDCVMATIPIIEKAFSRIRLNMLQVHKTIRP